MDQYFDRHSESDPLASRQACTAWQLVKSYWQSDQRFIAYFFFAVVVVMTITLVGLDLLVNKWYNYFYDALQAYDRHGVLRLVIVFTVLATFYILMVVYRYYIAQVFGLRWRRWLTNRFISRWLQNHSYYLIENFDGRTDNPDQRIQEDVGALVSSSMDLSMGLISAVTTFLAFIYVLWQLSGDLTVPLGSYGTINIPGYLVWVSALYAIIGTIFTLKIGRPLVLLNFEQQHREANFRFSAINLRSHAENVALYRGEEQQKGLIGRLFNKVLDNWYMIILRQRALLWFTAGYNQISIILPLAMALPNYFDKIFLLGGLMQTLSAFGKVQESLSFVVQAYPRIAEWQAVTQRLTTFVDHMNSADADAERENKVDVQYHAENEIAIKGLTINTTRKSQLLGNINEILKHQNHYLIKGRSGIGKSTFIRTIAGIWPYAAGEIIFPEDKQIMFLPQKPYMPMGTLAEAIQFPEEDQRNLKGKLEAILRDCHLEKFIPRLYETATWSEQLSPGELQRIAFARVLLSKPDWVFMDESTSMLDLANEEHLYQLLKIQLPDCSIVSVGHRPSLDVHHTHVINMEKYSHLAQAVV